MILSFSEFMPWVDVDGNKIATEFQPKSQTGIKKHTFRTDKRWKPGMKIHPYLNNPRNGGTPFNFQIQHAENWYMETLSRKFNKTEPFQIAFTAMPDHKTAVPILDGFEPFKFTFKELGENGTIVSLWIDGVLMFEVNYNMIGHGITCKHWPYFQNLEMIATNDGLTNSNFLRWFIHLSRKHSQKEITGKLLHWTPFRYVASVPNADPFTPEKVTMKKARLNAKIYL